MHMSLMILAMRTSAEKTCSGHFGISALDMIRELPATELAVGSVRTRYQEAVSMGPLPATWLPMKVELKACTHYP